MLGASLCVVLVKRFTDAGDAERGTPEREAS
jgi:hypothetical protein